MADDGSLNPSNWMGVQYGPITGSGSFPTYPGLPASTLGQITGGSNPFDAPGANGVPGMSPGGSNPEGIGTSSDPNLANSHLTSSGIIDSISPYFVRGFIMLLGLIFIGVGLAMFRPVPSITIPKAAPKVGT